MMLTDCLGRGSGAKQSRELTRRKDGVWWRRQQWIPGVVVLAVVVGFFFLVNWWMFSRLQYDPSAHREDLGHVLNSALPGNQINHARIGGHHQVMNTRLLALAAHALADAEEKPEPDELWKETLAAIFTWKPCADRRSWMPGDGTNGYILVSANGGISQQRVAICNAVAIARLLNSTLVLPKFLYSNVWQDSSQFSDIYEEEHFVNYLKADIKIVKELPAELQSLDLEARGIIITDAEIRKEEKPSFYVKKILPILLKKKVVHFSGFGNHLAFDPIPFDLQRLRCRCNFHALRFVKKIQETGALLIRRMRQPRSHPNPLVYNLVGSFAVSPNINKKSTLPSLASRYLAVHLRYEIEMAAYSLCYFGGGKEEVEELEAYRQIHFPVLTALRKTTKMPSPNVLRSEGQCPFTPEEAILLLVALGFKRKTRIYVAGAHIYGGRSRMAILKSLYPYLVTKDDLLSPSELEPFRNFSSQQAALDFIVCAAADTFAMTDSGSQLSSLVAGYRVYYGGGRHPTILPNKRRLAGIFARNSTIEWKQFEARVLEAIKQSKVVQERPIARSVYRHPRCLECMCSANL
ncbi:hypothetical protein HPP92_014764 [Vanilla planifolia]|uniref:O-fucosyltransferase family protein n=1 Tax=Vanilla planifolia TaxID=51239 RepID=A0A835QNX3_VANPL|nr:hypothetical protein HPP92_014764 [Vanilla planifolia]